MSLPTTQREQQKWIFQETGRQLASPITAIIRKVRDNKESRELDRFMEETLIDPGLIDRILDGNEEPDPADLFVHPVPVVTIHASDKATPALMDVARAVSKMAPRQSLDGIFAR